MDIRNRRALKEMARDRLAAANYDPRKLALIHTAVSVAAALVIAVLGYVLDHWIAGTASGLSGMGNRRILEAVQMTLQYVQFLATPFWEMGFVFVALNLLRQEQTQPKNMLEGFRRFGPVLRLRLLQGFLYLGAAIGCMYVASFLFVLTPASQKVVDTMLPLMGGDMSVEHAQQVLSAMPTEELVAMSVPFLVIFGILFLLVALVLYYRFWMADFLVMDQPNTGALAAMFISGRLTRKKRWALLKLDLSFWWFYLLMLLAAVVCYMDVLLPWLGISLPMTGDVAWMVFYVLSLLVQLVVFWRYKAYVQTTRAAAYEILREELPELLTPQPQPQPKPKFPWDNYESK